MRQDFIALVDGFKLLTLVVLIMADFVLGVIVALKAGTFQFAKIAQFLNTSVLAMVGGYFIVGVIAVFEPTWANIVPVTWGLMDVALLAGITGKLNALGVPMPKILSN